MTSNSLTPIINSITALLSTAAGRPILIALDGRCGSGKTTLAAQLAERFPGSRTIHTDDYYLPPAQRWIPLEEGYFAKYSIEESADLILDPEKGMIEATKS